MNTAPKLHRLDVSHGTRVSGEQLTESYPNANDAGTPNDAILAKERSDKSCKTGYSQWDKKILTQTKETGQDEGYQHGQ